MNMMEKISIFVVMAVGEFLSKSLVNTKIIPR